MRGEVVTVQLRGSLYDDIQMDRLVEEIRDAVNTDSVMVRVFNDRLYHARQTVRWFMDGVKGPRL